MSLKVGIVGAAGYAGAELIRLVLGHPEFELVAITSNADAGQPLSAVYPSFTGVSDLVFTTHDAPELKNCDAVFLAVPHTAAMAQVPALLASGVSCFDLSADYRLNDASVFEAWYAAEHTSPELLKTRAFGLPELFCQDLETAASDHADGKPVLVACAGCYPTATSLAAAPAVRRGDRRAAEKDVLPLCDACIEEVRALKRCWRALWMNSLRPFGFEVIDIRLSAQIGRLETARERIGAFAQGRLDDIPELTEEKLPYLKRADGTLANLNIWSACVSPTNVSWSF